jgi:hypothetical protein
VSTSAAAEGSGEAAAPVESYLVGKRISQAPIAAVMSGRNGLDFAELRAAVLRIPEVSLRVREAQGIIDEMCQGLESPPVTVREDGSTVVSFLPTPRIDLFLAISGDDASFFRNSTLKSLCCAVVQVGLFDRLIKTQKVPMYLAGPANTDSALSVISGRQSFREMVETSQALASLRRNDPSRTAAVLPGGAAVAAALPIPLLPGADAAPLLAGVSLCEFVGVQIQSDPLDTTVVVDGVMDLKAVIQGFAREGVTQFINIGPMAALRGSEFRAAAESDEIEIIDSIEMDPMLSWFWSGMRPQALALTQ